MRQQRKRAGVMCGGTVGGSGGKITKKKLDQAFLAVDLCLACGLEDSASKFGFRHRSDSDLKILQSRGQNGKTHGMRVEVGTHAQHDERRGCRAGAGRARATAIALAIPTIGVDACRLQRGDEHPLFFGVRAFDEHLLELVHDHERPRIRVPVRGPGTGCHRKGPPEKIPAASRVAPQIGGHARHVLRRHPGHGRQIPGEVIDRARTGREKHPWPSVRPGHGAAGADGGDDTGTQQRGFSRPGRPHHHEQAAAGPFGEPCHRRLGQLLPAVEPFRVLRLKARQPAIRDGSAGRPSARRPPDPAEGVCPLADLGRVGHTTGT